MFSPSQESIVINTAEGLKDPPPRVSAVMSRTTSTTSESVEIYLFRVLNWNSGVQGEAGIVGVGTGSHESETER